MNNIKDELNRLAYETWQIYELMRILVYIINENNQIQDINDDLYNTLILAKDIEKRLKPITNELDVLSIK